MEKIPKAYNKILIGLNQDLWTQTNHVLYDDSQARHHIGRDLSLSINPDTIQ